MTVTSVAEIMGYWTAALILPFAGLIAALVIFAIALYAVKGRYDD